MALWETHVSDTFPFEEMILSALLRITTTTYSSHWIVRGYQPHLIPSYKESSKALPTPLVTQLQVATSKPEQFPKTSREQNQILT